MVFGDHGFADVRHTHHLNAILAGEGLVALDGRGAVTRRHAWAAGNGGSAHVYVLDGAPRTTGERLRERFGAIAGVEVIGPERYADLGLPPPGPGAAPGDLVLAADDGVFFTGHASAEAAARAPVYVAAHGHRPHLERLGAALVMAGPGVRAGAALGDVSMLSLAPTAARLLGIDLPGAEAAPLDEALDTGLAG
jgi:hypothetical protein